MTPLTDPVFCARDMAAIHSSLELSPYPAQILIQLPCDILFMEDWGYPFRSSNACFSSLVTGTNSY